MSEEHETFLVPLFLKSRLRAPTWLITGGAVLLVGSVLVLAAVTAGKAVGAAGVVVLVVSIALICRGLIVWTEKIRLASDNVARVTALSRSKIPWGQVELYSFGLLAGSAPPHAWYCLEGAGHRIRFRTRSEAYRNLDALLRSRCPKAFLHDYLTGWITPPAVGRADAEMGKRFRRIAARTGRRYALLAAAQIVGLPAVLALAALTKVVPRLRGMPTFYRPSDIRANFRRATNARRSYRQNGQPTGG